MVRFLKPSATIGPRLQLTSHYENFEGGNMSSVWLIKWEWVGDHAAVSDPIVDIVTARRGIEYVSDYLQRLHDLLCLTFTERAGAEKYRNPNQRPYEVIRENTREGKLVLHVGHNPFLTARVVTNFAIDVEEESDLDVVRWTFEGQDFEVTSLPLAYRLESVE